MQPANVQDFREMARRRLPAFLFDYIDGGAYGEETLRRNVADFADVMLRQRVLRDVSSIDTRTTLFGETLAAPVALAPVGLAGFYARRGEVQAARACRQAGTPFALSTLSLCSLEEVAAAAAPPWLQLYMVKDRGFMDDLLARARGIGCRVLLFTVDLPVPGARYRDVRSGFALPPTLPRQIARMGQALSRPAWAWQVGVRGRPHALGNLSSVMAPDAKLDLFWGWVSRNFDPSVTWDDLAWIRERWPGPLVLKGLLTAEDARRAADLNVEGVVVSNHGGRQLDGVPSTIAALPEIAQAVGDRTAILLDGGVRSGLDIARALALGARAVLVGRPWAWALAAGGEAGVSHLLALLQAELKVAMALTGCTRPADLDASCLVDRRPPSAA